MAPWPVAACLAVIAAAALAATWSIARLEGPRRRPRGYRKVAANDEGAGGGGGEAANEKEAAEFAAGRAWEVIPAGRILQPELWQACHGALDARWLLLYRGAAFCYTLYIMGFCYSKLGVVGSYFFYTQWNYTMLTAYFGVATWVSARGCLGLLQPKSSSDGPMAEPTEATAGVPVGTAERASIFRQDLKVGPLSRAAAEAGPLGYIHQILYQVTLPMAVIVDVVLWGILFPIAIASGDLHHILNFLSINQHAINFFLIAGDFLLNSMRFAWFRAGYMIIFSGLYVLYQWYLHYTYGWGWAYPFLENSKPLAPLWYIGLLAFHLLVYWLWVSLHRAKLWCYPAGREWIAYLKGGDAVATDLELPSSPSP